MGVMFVNTGRAASRVCYLVSARQQQAFAVSRHHLDAIVTDWIMGENRQVPHARPQPASHLADAPVGRLHLAELRRSLDHLRSLGHPATPALTFHGVRPRLAHPFHESVNHELLSAVRDDVGIDTAVLVIRPLDDVLKSEWNRLIAGRLGNWRFPERDGWRHRWRLDDLLGSQPVDDTVDPNPSTTAAPLDPADEAVRIAGRTGHQAALWDLFAAVFPMTVVLPYRLLVNDPTAAFDAVGRIAGIDYGDHALHGVHLNGLANRFLTYNPVTIDLRLPGVARQVEFRFELADVADVDEDWGRLVDTDVDCSSLLAPIADAFDGPLILAARQDQLAELDQPTRRLLRDPIVLRTMAERVAPAWVRNFQVATQRYRDAAVTAVPAPASDVFEQTLAEDRQRMDAILRDPSVVLTASGRSTPSP